MAEFFSEAEKSRIERYLLDVMKTSRKLTI